MQVKTNKKTLYVSDLDGTLLRKNQRTSDYTNEMINSLIAKGMHFSYATARSSYTSVKVTQGLTAGFPLIVYNGAFILDNQTGRHLVENYFPRELVVTLLQLLKEREIAPLVYAFVEGRERFSYELSQLNQATIEFVNSRQDERQRPVDTFAQLLEGDIFYITCIGEEEKVKPIYEQYKERLNCIFHKDIYSGEYWLEMLPKMASKANAVVQLKKYLGCDRVVVFGDAMNDASMFDIADESYAVANAVDALKEKATAVIGSNEEDAVAHWLEKRFEQELG